MTKTASSNFGRLANYPSKSNRFSSTSGHFVCWWASFSSLNWQIVKSNLTYSFQTFIQFLTSYCTLFLSKINEVYLGVMNGPLKFLTARKILPLLDLLAKFKPVLAKFLRYSQARNVNFLFLLVLGMLANARKDHLSPLYL